MQRSKNFDRRVDAERHLIDIESRKLTGTYIDPKAGRVGLGEFAEHTTTGWINRRESTKVRDDSYLATHILPAFGTTPINTIRPTDIQQWVGQLDTAGYAPATIRKAYQILGRIMTDAVQAGLIAQTPCRNITLPRVQTTEMRFLTPTQIDHLATTIHPRYRALILTAAYTGARFGELTALDTNQYHPDKPAIRIERTLTEVNGRLRYHEPKTPAARRTITLPPWLPEVLDDHLTNYPPNEEGLIFTAPEHGPIRRHTFRQRTWLPAIAASVGQPMRFHDLRHTHVALLINQGTHPAVIASRLGHTSVTTVLDVYGHLYDGLDRTAANNLQAPWTQAQDATALRGRGTETRELELD